MKRVGWLLVLCLVVAMPLSAGIHYKARTYSDGARSGQPTDMTVESWVDGEKAKVLFSESANPTMKQGTYLVTTDGGETVFLVNTEEETYFAFDLQQMLAAADELMQSSGGMFEIKISDPQVEVLEEGSGGSILGYPTTLYKMHTSFRMDMKIMGMKRSQDHDQAQDMWTTTEFNDQAMGIWLRRDPPDMGDSGLGELIKLHSDKVKGFPLKTVTNVTTTNKKGKQTTQQNIMEVTEISETSIDGEIFIIPEHYQETQFVPETQAGEDEQPQNPLKGMFGRKKKKG